ncbi:MAG: FtsH protease activity modulator HflK [Desulfomonile sp.]|nr:FtsH protease activity modulator HflK [Desulfomonile sp.]
MDQFRPRDDQYGVRDLQQGVEDVRRVVDRFMRGRGIWLLVVLVVVIYLLSGIYQVGQGEVGVVLRFGKFHAITEPGLRYRLPQPFMSHKIVNVAQVRRAEIGYRSERGDRTRQVPAESLMLTGDEQIVDVQFFVQYKVDDPVKFLFGSVDPTSVLRASAEVAIRGVVGENTIDHTMTEGRGEIQARVGAYLQRLLDICNTGLRLTEANLLVVDPPAQVQEAFHDVVRAREDSDRVIKEAEGYKEDIIPKARGEAQREIKSAEAYRSQRVTWAKGDAQRFTRVLEEYVKAPAVTRERLYLETVEQFLAGTRNVVVDGDTARVLPVLPLMGLSQSPTGPPTKGDRTPSPSGEKGN